MIKKFFGVTGGALFAGILMLGYSSFAAAVTIVPTPEGSTKIFTGDEVFIIETGITGILGTSVVSRTFTHAYNFDIQTADTYFQGKVDVIDEPPDVGAVASGIANLTFTWDNGDVWNITDSGGFKLAGVSSLPVLITTLLANGLRTVTVTGIQLEGGGNYSLELAAVPLPAAALLFGSVLLGGGLMRRRKMIKEFGLPT